MRFQVIPRISDATNKDDDTNAATTKFRGIPDATSPYTIPEGIKYGMTFSGFNPLVNMME